MSTELLLNATICFAISISSFAFAWVLARSSADHSIKSKPALWSLISLWVLVGLTYLPTTLRMIMAYIGDTHMDQVLYYFSVVPFSFLAVPLVFFILYVIFGDQKVSGYVSLLFVVFGSAYLAFIYSGGVSGPTITPMTSMFTITSDLAISIYIIGLFVIPTAMIIGMIFLVFLQRMPKRLRYRTVLPLVAISFVFDFMLTDMMTPDDIMQLVARIFVLIGTVLAFLAYFPPLTLQEKLGIQKSGGSIHDREDMSYASEEENGDEDDINV